MMITIASFIAAATTKVLANRNDVLLFYLYSHQTVAKRSGNTNRFSVAGPWFIRAIVLHCQVFFSFGIIWLSDVILILNLDHKPNYIAGY
jgi:hypothetical protein